MWTHRVPWAARMRGPLGCKRWRRCERRNAPARAQRHETRQMAAGYRKYVALSAIKYVALCATKPQIRGFVCDEAMQARHVYSLLDKLGGHGRARVICVYIRYIRPPQGRNGARFVCDQAMQGLGWGLALPYPANLPCSQVC